MLKCKEEQKECFISRLINVLLFIIKTPFTIIKDNRLILSILGIKFDYIKESLSLKPFNTFLDLRLVSKIVFKAKEYKKRSLHYLHPLILLLQVQSYKHLIKVFSDYIYKKLTKIEFLADILF